MKKLIANLLLKLFAKYATEWSPDRTYIHGGLQPARYDLTKSTREELMRIAINMEHRNPIMQRLLDIWECYTVGAGLQISPASSDPEWNKRAKDWHQKWEEMPDINSRQNFGTLMSLVSRTWCGQGENFIILTNGEARAKRPAFPRIQLIEGRLCATPPDKSEFEGESIIDGCQIDNRGRTIGYYFAEEDSKARKTFGLPKPANTVIHVFEPSRPGQYRGVTMFHAVLNELRDLDDLHLFEMIACKDAAEKSNIVKSQNGELNAANLLRSRASATQQGVTTGSADNTENRASFVTNAIGGRTIALRTGEDLVQFRSERPSVVTREYWKYKTELVCSGVGIPYCMAFPDSMQGTVYRGALDMAATFFAQRFLVISDAIQRIYVRNMDWCRYNEPLLVDAPKDWFKVSINPPRACNVDVGYNSSATIAEMAAGLTTPAVHYGARGQNWREKFDELNECLKYSDSIGLTERLAKLNAAQKAQADPNKASNQEEENFVPIKQL